MSRGLTTRQPAIRVLLGIKNSTVSHHQKECSYSGLLAWGGGRGRSESGNNKLNFFHSPNNISWFTVFIPSYHRTQMNEIIVIKYDLKIQWPNKPHH